MLDLHNIWMFDLNDVERFAALIAGLEMSGLSRTEIAARSGLSRNTVWRIATGTASQPSYATVVRLTKFADNAVPVRHLEQKTG